MKVRAPFIVALVATLGAASVFFWQTHVTRPPKVTETPESPIDFDAAVKILSTTRVQPYAALFTWKIDGSTTENIKTMARELHEQLRAVEVIHNARKEVDLKVLIPSLWLTGDSDHLTREAFGGVGVRGNFDGSSPTDSMGERRRIWPVFAVILDMPNAAALLEKYALDKNNLLNCRADAYHVLNYLDKDRARKVAVLFQDQYQNEPKLGGFISYIDNVLNNDPGSGFDGPFRMFTQVPQQTGPQEEHE